MGRSASWPKSWELAGEGPQWNLIVITTGDSAMKEYLEQRLARLRPALLPEKSRVIVVARHQSMNNFDGSISVMAKILGEDIPANQGILEDMNLPADARVLIIHTAGHGARDYPVTPACRGNKGCINVPIAIQVDEAPEVLTGVEQAIRDRKSVV